jgi:hypothetical protein
MRHPYTANRACNSDRLTQDRHDGDQLIRAIEEIQRNTGQLPEQVVADGGYTKNTKLMR